MNEEFDTKEYKIPENNEIVEITDDDYKEDFTSFEQDVKPTEEVTDEIMELTVERENNKMVAKKKKTPLKEKWNNLPKITKIILIVLISLVIIGTIVLIVLLTKKDKPEEPKKKKEDIVIIEKDNYRYENGKLVLLNDKDEKVGEYECSNKNEKNCFVAYQTNDNFDEDKFIYEDGNELSRISPIFANKYAFIFDNKNVTDSIISLYDMENNESIEQYKSVKAYNVNDVDYLVLENTNSMYGLYRVNDTELQKILDFEYDYLGIIKRDSSKYNKLVAQKNGKYILIDFNGKETSKKITNEIKSFSDKYIVTVDDNGSYVLLDYNNNKVFENTYDYLKLDCDLVFAVSSKKLLVLDYDEKSLKNDTINLTNDYYNKTYMYRDDGKYSSTNEAFWVTDNEGSITIEYYGANETIKSVVVNVNESVVARGYDYVSYYDGLLYFYDDEDKNNLIGTYPCTNKNEITSKSSKYDFCYLAKESSYSNNELDGGTKVLGYLPLINKRFVFINDSLDPEIPNIVLYDIVDKKSLGSYSSVDALLHDGKTSLEFENNENFEFIGKSTRKDKFGVVSLSADSASSVLAMEYDSIEKIGSYFEVKKSSGTWQLYDMEGSSVTNELGNKVVNYSTDLLKTKQGSEYEVHNYDGTKVVDKTFSFVDLKNSYFVTINSNKNIEIYEIDNSEPIVDSEATVVDVVDYVKTTKSGNNYNVVVGNQTLTLNRSVVQVPRIEDQNVEKNEMENSINE